MPKRQDTNRNLTDIELALAKYFTYEKNVIVFNVRGESWLFPLTHEADMLVVGKDRRLTEIEIKRSWQDFKADFEKNHLHDSTDSVGIERFIYAVPDSIFEKIPDFLQEKKVVPSNVITYDENLNVRCYKVLYSMSPEMEGRSLGSTYVQAWPWDTSLMASDTAKLFLERKAIRLRFTDRYPTLLFRRGARPLYTEQLQELMRLGCMRQVALRRKISELDRKLNKKAIIQSYEDRITNLETVLREYREQFEKEVGYKLDEKEVLFG